MEHIPFGWFISASVAQPKILTAIEFAELAFIAKPAPVVMDFVRELELTLLAKRSWNAVVPERHL